MKKLKIFEVLSAALIAVGTIISVPFVMASCKQSADSDDGKGEDGNGGDNGNGGDDGSNIEEYITNLEEVMETYKRIDEESRDFDYFSYDEDGARSSFNMELYQEAADWYIEQTTCKDYLYSFLSFFKTGIENGLFGNVLSFELDADADDNYYDLSISMRTRMDDNLADVEFIVTVNKTDGDFESVITMNTTTTEGTNHVQCTWNGTPKLTEEEGETHSSGPLYHNKNIYFHISYYYGTPTNFYDQIHIMLGNDLEVAGSWTRSDGTNGSYTTNQPQGMWNVDVNLPYFIMGIQRNCFPNISFPTDSDSWSHHSQ